MRLCPAAAFQSMAALGPSASRAPLPGYLGTAFILKPMELPAKNLAVNSPAMSATAGTRSVLYDTPESPPKVILQVLHTHRVVEGTFWCLDPISSLHTLKVTYWCTSYTVF